MLGDLEALAHPIRLRLLAALAANPGRVCVCDLEAIVPVKQPTVSHHLRILRKAGLVDSERRGLWAHYRVRREALRALAARVGLALDALAGVPASADPGSDAVVIRPAEPADLTAVLDLLTAAALPRAGVAEHFGDGYVVAAEGGRVVGAAGVERYGSHGLLRSVVVDAGHRGRGIGEALVQDRLHGSAAAGLEALFLLTTTAPRFFARLRFEVIERNRAPAPVQASPEFAAICPGDAVAMMLRLTQQTTAEDRNIP